MLLAGAIETAPDTRAYAVVTALLGHSTIVLTSNTCGHVLEPRKREVARGRDAVLGG